MAPLYISSLFHLVPYRKRLKKRVVKDAAEKERVVERDMEVVNDEEAVREEGKTLGLINIDYYP